MPLTEQIQKLVGPALSMIVANGRQKVGEILRYKKRKSDNRDSVVQKSSCVGCPCVYQLSNAFVAHAEKKGHLANWTAATCVEKKIVPKLNET